MAHETITETASLSLEERVKRLRAGYFTSAQGHEVLVELTPAKMVQTDPDVLDFSDWSQWSQWPQSY